MYSLNGSSLPYLTFFKSISIFSVARNNIEEGEIERRRSGKVVTVYVKGARIGEWAFILIFFESGSFSPIFCFLNLVYIWNKKGKRDRGGRYFDKKRFILEYVTCWVFYCTFLFVLKIENLWEGDGISRRYDFINSNILNLN